MQKSSIIFTTRKIEEAKGTDTTIDVVEGMQFDRGYISPYFVTNTEKMEVEMERPYILIYDKKISNLKEKAKIGEEPINLNRSSNLCSFRFEIGLLSVRQRNQRKFN